MRRKLKRDTLLSIDGPFGSLRITGRRHPRYGISGGISIPVTGALRIEGIEPVGVDVSFVDFRGEYNRWDAVECRGPVLFEDTNYDLFVVGKDNMPVVNHRDPLLTQNLNYHLDQESCVGVINFARQVGICTLEVTFGRNSLYLALEVFPTKIDYQTDYQDLKYEVNSIAHGLALAYMRSTEQSAGIGDELASNIDMVTNLRQRMSMLDGAIQFIGEVPHRQLVRDVKSQPIHKMKRMDAEARKAISQGRGAGKWCTVEGLGPIRERIPSLHATSTLDTPEHRWIAMHLGRLQRSISEIRHGLDLHEAEQFPRSVGIRRKQVLREMETFQHLIEEMLERPAIREATRDTVYGPPSLTLLSAPGYRDIYFIVTSLQRSLNLEGHSLNLEIKDVHELYEVWCYLKLIEIVSSMFGAVIDCSRLVQSSQGGLKIGLRSGLNSRVIVSTVDRKIVLEYNRAFPGETGNQAPDIVIQVVQDDLPDVIVVLDAKYRVDASVECRRRYGYPAPPIDSINGLHRYRDAIVTEAADRAAVRPVVRGAALFPLTIAESDSYEEAILFRSLQSLGIGAIPFLPSNADFLSQWLREVLFLGPDQLYWDGPPRSKDVVATGR